MFRGKKPEPFGTSSLPPETAVDPEAEGTRALERFVSSTGPQVQRGRETVSRIGPTVLPVIVRAVEGILDDPVKLERFEKQAVAILSKRMNPRTARTLVQGGVTLARAAVERGRRGMK